MTWCRKLEDVELKDVGSIAPVTVVSRKGSYTFPTAA